MATPSNRPPHIHPAMRVVMRLPETDKTTNPWTGAPITSGRNFEDPEVVNENTPLAAPEGKSAAQVLFELEGPREFVVEEPVSESLKPQFSLAELMLLMTVAAVGLAGARVLPAGPFACLVGIMTFVAMWLTGNWKIQNRWMHLGVWCLLLMYIAAAAVAVVRSF